MKLYIESILYYHDRMSVFILGFIISILLSVMAIIESYLIFVALGVHISLAESFLIFPITMFAATLPIGLGGIGLGETSLLILLDRLGVSAAAVVSFSIANHVLVLSLVAGPFTFYLGRIGVRLLNWHRDYRKLHSCRADVS
jgi:uncharacterized protein (TIRG00374 family)